MQGLLALLLGTNILIIEDMMCFGVVESHEKKEENSWLKCVKKNDYESVQLIKLYFFSSSLVAYFL